MDHLSLFVKFTHNFTVWHVKLLTQEVKKSSLQLGTIEILDKKDERFSVEDKQIRRFQLLAIQNAFGMTRLYVFQANLFKTIHILGKVCC